MQRSPSENERPPATQRSPPRDPRIKIRTNSSQNANHAAEPESSRPADRRESLWRYDGTSSTSTPQSSSGRHEQALPAFNDLWSLQKNFSRYIQNTQSADFLRRRLSFLKRERNAARSEYEATRQTADKFPIIVDQAQQRVLAIEAEYNTVKQEEANARAAENSSLDKCIRALLETTRDKIEEARAKDPKQEALTELVARMQRELDEVRARPERAVAEATVSLELQGRIEKLEDLHAQRFTIDKSPDARIKSLERETDSIRKTQVIDKEMLSRQLEAIQSKQRAFSEETTQALTSLSSEMDACSQRVKQLEQALPSIKAQAEQLQSLLTVDKEQRELLQSTSEIKQQATTDQLDRLRKSTHLRVENMKDEIASWTADLTSVVNRMSGLSEDNVKQDERLKALENRTATGDAGLASLEGNIAVLKKSDQDQAERVSALESLMEEMSEKIGSLETQIDGSSRSTELAEQVSVLRTQLDVEMRERETRLDQQSKKLREQMDQELKEHWDPARSQVVESVKAISEELSQLKSEMDILIATQRHTGSRNDEALLDMVRAVQNEQKAFRVSFDNYRVHTNTVTNQLIRETDRQLPSLQKQLEKLSHVSVNLNHRFNNLTTESLARQIAAVVNKALPKLETSLQTLEREINTLHQKAATPLKAETINPEVVERLKSLNEDVQRLEAKLTARHDTLAKDFEEGRDAITQKIEDLEGSVGRQDDSLSIYRGSTTKNVNLDDVHARLAVTDTQLSDRNSQGVQPRKSHLAKGRTNVPTASPVSSASSNSTSQARAPPIIGPTSKKLDDKTILDSNYEDDDDDQDSAEDAQDLLRQWQKRPPSQPTPSSSVRQSPRTSVHVGHGSTKRKRSPTEAAGTAAKHKTSKGRSR